MQRSELEGRRVALWGLGREGRAAWRALRALLPDQALTVFCPEAERAEVAALGDPCLHWQGPADAESLSAFDVVVKSPGISAYRPELLAARSRGTRFTSGTALWFGEAPPGAKVCITGTKGKSSTTALLAHLLRSAGRRVGLAGNIGLPLLELIDPPQPPDVWAIELSSYQTADAEAPDVAMVLNLHPEHLDWHGSLERYFADKLALVTRARPGRVVLNHADPRLRALGESLHGVLWFAHEAGWHVRDGDIYRGDRQIYRGADLPLAGAHNRLNLCAALAAIEALGDNAAACAASASTFQGLPHRLHALGERNGVSFVDDSISTTPEATLAALQSFPGRTTAVLIGGFDRGVPWEGIAARLGEMPPALLVCRGQNGSRIAQTLARERPALRIACVEDFEKAVGACIDAVGPGGLVLLSPGAPSFPEFRDYAERGRRFAVCAGFDPGQAQIAGLGIA